MGFLAVFQLITMVLSGLPAAIQAVESIIGAAKGQGAVKKDLVLQAVQTSLNVAAATGNKSAGDTSTQSAVMTFAGGAVDAIVAVWNTIDGWIKPTAPPVTVTTGTPPATS